MGKVFKQEINAEHKKPGSRDIGLKWHPAFVGAIKTELENYRDCLDFQNEVPLTAEPLVIDCVIIRKTRDTVIEKKFRQDFQGSEHS